MNFSNEMRKQFSSNGRPVAVFVTELDDLSFSLCKNLIKKSCKIFLITKKRKRWKEIIRKLWGPGNIAFLNINEIYKLERIDYFLYHYNLFRALSSNHLTAKKEIKKEISILAQKTASFRPKNILLLPVVHGMLINRESIVGRLVYFSESFGPHMILTKNLFIFSALEAYAKEKRLMLPKEDETFRPVFSDTLADKILKILFSIAYPYEITLVGETISAQTFLTKLNFDPEKIETKKRSYKNYYERSIGQKISLGEIAGLSQTTQFLKDGGRPPVRASRKVKYSSGIAIFIITLVLLPFFTLLISGTLLATSFLLAKKGQFFLSKTALITSRDASKISELGFGILSGIPGVKRPFAFFATISEIFARSANLGEKSLLLVENANSLFAKFIEGKPYSVLEYSQRLSTELDYVYRESGFILGEIYSDPYLASNIEKIRGFTELSKKREYLVFLAQLSEDLPQLFGEAHPRKYLILLQNNMELRPTGGFIGSFALVSVESGALTNLEIWDVFEADGQLKGHVEPPLPIKAYLNEANWFLRDSNWDPDFGISAARAEWFLDKEIDEKVDGVVAVDLEFVKRMLTVTGPLTISDYDVVVDEKNFYEVTQKEVEEDFFPGSTKKSGFLTAVYKALSEEAKEIDAKKGIALGINVLENLQERHVQIFAHEKSTARAIKELGWDGSISKIGACGDNCYSDILGIVEANVGVNKANINVTRSFSASINLLEGKLKREFTVHLNNSNDKGLGEKGIYKAYIRAIASQKASFRRAKLVRGGGGIEVTPELEDVRDRKEAGVMVIVAPQETVSLTFSWEEPTGVTPQKGGEYRFLIRKQAGTSADPIAVSITGLGNSLTGQPSFVYNTLLARDFVSRVSW